MATSACTANRAHSRSRSTSSRINLEKSWDFTPSKLVATMSQMDFAVPSKTSAAMTVLMKSMMSNLATIPLLVTSMLMPYT